MFPSHRIFEDDEPLPDEGEEGDGDALEALRGADVATLERMQGMAEDFAIWLHRQGAEQMEAGGDKAVAQVRQLSHSFNRAARAVRQIMVLKQEAAGLRPTPHARPAAANGNGPAGGRGGSGGGGSGRDRNDLDDYADEDERRKKAAADVDAYFAVLLQALQVDVEAAGPEMIAEAKRASTAAKLTRIAAGIPHPTLDATVARLQLEWLQELFRRKPGQGPPQRGT
jgi:hypothetical protein